MTEPGRGAVRLSSQGFAVLRACAASPLRLQKSDCDAGGVGGAMYVTALVRLAPGRPAVARASVSRTLRRLWRHGWVELVSAYGYSLTARHANAAAELQAAERDPEGTYAEAQAFGGFFPFDTPEEYLDHLRYSARRSVRHLPMCFVQITSAGRVRLTSQRGEVNRKAEAVGMMNRRTVRPSRTRRTHPAGDPCHGRVPWLDGVRP